MENAELIEKQRAYIDSLCKKHDLTVTEVALKAKIAHTTLTRLFKEGAVSPLTSTTLNKVSSYFNEPYFFKIAKAPLVGYVRGGGEVILYSESQIFEMVDAPAEAAEEGVEALVVRGESMWPVFKDGEILFYSKECDFDPSYIGRDCVVELENGQRLVKILKRGTKKNLFTLDSYNLKPIEDVKIKWACPVKWTKKF